MIARSKSPLEACAIANVDNDIGSGRMNCCIVCSASSSASPSFAFLDQDELPVSGMSPAELPVHSE